MVQRKTLVIDSGHQAFDELDAADVPDLSATYATPSSVTTAVSNHAGAADPHTGYLKESDFTGVDFLVGTATGITAAEIVVGTSPGGELGGTWASPTVDATHSGSAHTDFIAKAFFAAKGDLITASANDTPSLLTVGADDTILMADSGAGGGLKWVASASPSAVSTAAATGTADTFTRGDHVHAHEAAHINHDTTWAAKGDLIAGTANDTASVLTVGANDTVLTADSTAGTGLKWAASASGAARDEENLILHMRTYA